mgnify:CR=1 FL=1
MAGYDYSKIEATALRLFERFEVQPGAQPEKFSVLLNLEGRKARLDVTAASVFNPFRLREISQFRCPGAM